MEPFLTVSLQSLRCPMYAILHVVIHLTDERGVELDLAPLGGEGDGDVEDAGALLDVGLDGVDARRARHAADLRRNNENALIWRSAPGILRIPP